MTARNYNRRYTKDYGFIRTAWITFFLHFVVHPCAVLFYNVKIEGKENIEKGKRYIFTANHQSYIDPPLISEVAGHPVAYMAKEELFTHKNLLTRFLVISLGAFAVNREKPELATFKTIRDIATETKWSIGIFPEGKTNNTRSFKGLQKGFITIAKKAKFDIVPIGIDGFDGYATRLFQKHLTLKVGKPISYKLTEDEIFEKWLEFMCQATGYTKE